MITTVLLYSKSAKDLVDHILIIASYLIIKSPLFGSRVMNLMIGSLDLLLAIFFEHGRGKVDYLQSMEDDHGMFSNITIHDKQELTSITSTFTISVIELTKFSLFYPQTLEIAS